MRFMEVLETIRQEQAQSAAALSAFYHESGDGHSIRSTRGRNTPQYKAALVEAAKLVARVYKGTLPVRVLQEAMTTSDFPYLFGDILDRQMLGHYNETPQTFRNIARIKPVPDFREVKRLTVDGGESVLDPVGVGSDAEYPETKLTDGEYKYSVSKFGRRMPFAWESFINDDMDALKDVPARFGRAARRTEEKFATKLYVDANGPHASLYTAGNKNIINITNAPNFEGARDNPALDILGLQQGLFVLANQVDSESEPIVYDAVELVVTPASEIQARNILNATELWIGGNGVAEGGGTTATQLKVANWMRNRLRLSVAPYIPIVATALKTAPWFLFASASSGRPALEMGFLRGHEQPEIFMKESNARRVGGGSVEPMAGSFENDSIDYKIRHIMGGCRLDPKATVSSTGANGGGTGA